MNKIRVLLQKLKNEQSGYAMIIALLIFALGLLLVPVLLNFVSSGMESSRQVYERKTAENYAADAGVARAMWYIKYQNENVPDYFAFDLNQNQTGVSIISEFNPDDNLTHYYINSVAGSTTVNAQVIYSPEIPEIPGDPEEYTFANAIATGLTGDIALNGAAVINSDNGQEGNIYCGNNLSLSGSSSIEGNVYAYSDVSLSWSAVVDGDALASGSISGPGTVTGESTSGADSQDPPEIADSVLDALVQGVYDSTFNLPELTPSGTYYNRGLTIKNTTSEHYPAIYVEGNLILQNVNSGLVFEDQVYVTGSINVKGSLDVVFNGPVYAGGQIYTGSGGGTVVFQDSVSAGSLRLANNFQFAFNGPLKSLGDLYVGNSAVTTFADTIYVGGDFQYGGASDMDISAGIYVAGDLLLSNSADINGPQEVVVRGNLTLAGDAQLTAEEIPFIILPPARITPALSPLVDPQTVTLSNSARASAAIYAPTAAFTASGDSRLYGSLICASATINNSSQVTYLTGISGRADLPHSGTPGQAGQAEEIGLIDWGVQ